MGLLLLRLILILWMLLSYGALSLSSGALAIRGIADAPLLSSALFAASLHSVGFAGMG